MIRYKYSIDDLKAAVEDSISYAGVLRKLGIKQAGGSQTHIKKRIVDAGIDVSHFMGMGHNRGKISHKRKTADEILIIRTPLDNKPKTSALRRSLLELGRKEVCEECGVGTLYNDKTLVLEIDHISGESWDSRAENLRFLCPNCHSQQNTSVSWKYSKTVLL